MKVFLFLFCYYFLVTARETRDIKYKERYIENLDPHKGTATECKGKRMLMSDQLKESRCMPRKILIKLRPESGFTYIPDVVSVNRCEGFCGPHSCLPSSWSTTSVVVRRYPINSNRSTCHVVHIDEHTKCKCGCNVMEEDCNSKQSYMEEECACKCMNIMENISCSTQKGMIWDSKNCECVCDVAAQECSTGYRWIPSLCRCGKVMWTDEEELVGNKNIL